AFKDYYRKVDSFLGAIWGRLRGETMFIMSDHGFTGITKQVYLNQWLAGNGYLKLKENARSIEDIADGSSVFALDPGRIYINIKGKYPAGTVDRRDAPTLIEEIKGGLSQISDDGKRVVAHIYDRDSIFSGSCVDFAPDLCVQGVYGYDMKGAVNKTGLMDREIFTGMHTQDDATFYINEPGDSLTAARPNIIDVAPSVLDCLGIETAAGMDGRSIIKH
ncbi:MAG TPA: alkaline phosphatase family protein, partial [Blastocatellia bacterium]|nr:alkaline phosphatase family protein [Blastocatellia bacterium]